MFILNSLKIIFSAIKSVPQNLIIDPTNELGVAYLNKIHLKRLLHDCNKG